MCILYGNAIIKIMKYSLIVLFFLVSCTGENPKEKVSQKKGEQSVDALQVSNDSLSGTYSREDAQNLKKSIEEKNGAIDTIVEVVNINTCVISLDAYIEDPSETATNVRKTPGGEVVLELPYAQDDYFLTIVDQKGDWFQVNSIEGIEESYDLPDGGAWVHNSVVGASTRNYANQEIVLYSSDDENAKKIDVISTEIALHILAVCGEWVKVKTEPDHSVGWIKKEWICGNPLTTCA